MSGKLRYDFSAPVWQHNSTGGWYFISLPEAMSREIRGALQAEEEGWGRLKATAEIGNCKWETAIWFDTKQNSYLLPLKAEIRKREKISAAMQVDVRIWL